MDMTKEQTPLDWQSVKDWANGKCLDAESDEQMLSEALERVTWLIGEVERLNDQIEFLSVIESERGAIVAGDWCASKIREVASLQIKITAANARAERLRGALKSVRKRWRESKTLASR